MTSQTKKQNDFVLIVDDTAANHDVIRSFLGDIHVICDSAFDGMEAITACGDHDSSHYSLILMDINLPHMNGFQTAERLHRMGVSSPIVAVTASGKDELNGGQADDVFDSVLYKPFNSAEFFAAISPYIRNASSCSLDTKTSDRKTDPYSGIDRQVCDISRGISNMGNSLRLFTKHLNNFKKNNADLVMRITVLLDQGQFDDCTALCHSIKGLSGMLGLMSLYENIILMEELVEKVSRDPRSRREADSLLAAINNDIRLICQLPV